MCYHVPCCGFKFEGAITTPFDMPALIDLDGFHLEIDAVDRLPQTGNKDIYPKRQLKDRLIDYKQFIDGNGTDLPDIRNRKRSGPT